MGGEGFLEWTCGYGGDTLSPGIGIVFEPADDTILTWPREGSMEGGGVAGDIEFVGEETSECDAGGVGRRSTLAGSALDLRDDLSDGIGQFDGGGAGPGPKDGNVTGSFFFTGLG
jgi:hypothetical protein